MNKLEAKQRWLGGAEIEVVGWGSLSILRRSIIISPRIRKALAAAELKIKLQK